MKYENDLIQEFLNKGGEIQRCKPSPEKKHLKMSRFVGGRQSAWNLGRKKVSLRPNW